MGEILFAKAAEFLIGYFTGVGLDYARKGIKNSKLQDQIYDILETDRYYIDELFCATKDSPFKDIIYDFLFDEVFNSMQYFYLINIPEHARNMLISDFETKYKPWDIAKWGDEERSNLIDCVNFHNSQLGKIYFDVTDGLKYSMYYRDIREIYDNMIHKTLYNKHNDVRIELQEIDFIDRKGMEMRLLLSILFALIGTVVTPILMAGLSGNILEKLCSTTFLIFWLALIVLWVVGVLMITITENNKIAQKNKELYKKDKGLFQ